MPNTVNRVVVFMDYQNVHGWARRRFLPQGADLTTGTSRNATRPPARPGTSGRAKTPTGTEGATHAGPAQIVILTIIGGIVIAAIIAVIVLVATNQPDRSRPPAETTSSTEMTAQSPTPGDEAARAIETFETNYRDMTRNAVILASSWRGSTARKFLTPRYKKAGFSDELAKSFTPVWSTIFGNNKAAEITTTVPASKNLTVNEVRGQEGSYVWVVKATVTFEGTWNENRTPHIQPPSTGIWWLTVDQASESITAIDQPRPEELQIKVHEKE